MTTQLELKNIWRYGMIIVFIGLIILSIAEYYYHDEEATEYCAERLPPIAEGENLWYSLQSMEEGYIECCRVIYDKQHKKTSECKTFPFESTI